MEAIKNNSKSAPPRLSRWRDTKSNKEYLVFDTFLGGISDSDNYVWLVELKIYIGDEPMRFLKISWTKWIDRVEKFKSIKMVTEEVAREMIA